MPSDAFLNRCPSVRSVVGRRRSRTASAAACLALLAGAPASLADDNPVFLQWFESRWSTMERRMPDFFVAGYDGVWLPPPTRTGDPSSPGYDAFDRFDLGSPSSSTLYGTEARLRALVAEFQRAGAQVFVDSIMNHNSGRTDNPAFIAAGGWPGFVMDLPGDFWGDFHDGSTQSTNPNDPNYDLFTGDLVDLIDIAQEKNHQLIRHPVEEGNPLNIPAGTFRNRPSPANARFYPDLDLPGRSFTNPAPRGGGLHFTMHPFNTSDAAAGDAVAENATGLLMRWSRWMIEDIGVDGFRLDAAKHIPQWFWDQYWDAAVFETCLTPAGTRVTPFSFGEVFGDPGFTRSYARKDGFGNRDVLDLNGGGALRDLLNAQGFGSWQNVLGAHIDVADDGFNNGTLGVNHVYSHDNGSAGNGGGSPPLPGPDRYGLPQHAYLLMRPGVSLNYHNAREFASLPSRGFWPREGNPTALGSDPHLVRLVQIANSYARGLFVPINNTDGVNGSMDDVLVFERRKFLGDGASIGNVLVAVNDRYDGGIETRNVLVSYPPGTRLHELTGNAADPVVDPHGVIPEVLVVGADGRLADAADPSNPYLKIPNNTGPTDITHHRGYVVYGPAAPSGVLSIGGAGAVLPPDGPGVESHSRRLTPIDVVTGPTFTIQLATSKTDPLDPNWDDNAIFRIDGGFRDFNGNGITDIGEGASVGAGYEEFLTFRRPLVSDPTQPGMYIQQIDASILDEGVHYISVLAFRRRTDGGDAIYTDFRRVVYVDRLPPRVRLDSPTGPVGTNTYEARVTALDRATDAVHIILNAPAGADPLTLVNAGNLATQEDRFSWRRSYFGLPAGTNTITIVAFEPTGNASVTTGEIQVVLGSGDVNRDGAFTMDDLYDAFRLAEYRPEGDLDADGDVDTNDTRLMELRLRQGEAAKMVGDQR